MQLDPVFIGDAVNRAPSLIWRRVRGSISVLFLMLLAGCESLLFPRATPEEEAITKSFVTDANRASVYMVDRDRSADGVRLFINRRELGSMGGKTSFHQRLPPGRYLVESQRFPYPPFLLPIEIEAQRQYFVRVEMDYDHGSLLRLASEDQGKTEVLASRVLKPSNEIGSVHPLGVNAAGVMLPLSLGVYYPPELVGFSVKNPVTRGFLTKKTTVYEIPLGTSGKWALDRALKSAFERVIELPAWPAAPGTARDLDLLVIFRFANTKLERPQKQWSPRPWVHLVAEVYTPALERIVELDSIGTSWDEGIEGEKPQQLAFPAQFWSAAMDNAAGGLINKLARLPQVAAKGRKSLSNTALALSERIVGTPSDKRAGVAIVPLANVGTSSNSDDIYQVMTKTEELEECLIKTFKSDLHLHRVIPTEGVRRAAFPWLQGETNLMSDELEAIMKWAPIAGELERMGVRFVLFPNISHTSTVSGPMMCGYGGPAAGCIGAVAGKESSKFTVAVWDVVRGRPLGTPIEGETTGTSWLVAYVIIPIWHNADTVNQACSEIAQQFEELTAKAGD